MAIPITFNTFAWESKIEISKNFKIIFLSNYLNYLAKKNNTINKFQIQNKK